MSLLAARPDADSSSPTSDLRERIRAATSDQRERILELRERQSPQEQSRQRCRFALRHGCPIDGVVSYMLFPFSRPASEPGGKRRITRTAFKRGLAILGSEIRNVRGVPRRRRGAASSRLVGSTALSPYGGEAPDVQAPARELVRPQQTTLQTNPIAPV